MEELVAWMMELGKCASVVGYTTEHARLKTESIGENRGGILHVAQMKHRVLANFSMHADLPTSTKARGNDVETVETSRM